MATSLTYAAFFFDTEPIGEPRLSALDACALCSKRLTRNSGIFMYKGDTPFCNQKCRYEQMHRDAAYARRKEQMPQSRGASMAAT